MLWNVKSVKSVTETQVKVLSESMDFWNLIEPRIDFFVKNREIGGPKMFRRKANLFGIMDFSGLS